MKFKLLTFFLAAFLVSCDFSPFEPIPPDLPGAPLSAPIDLYVATDGDDDNSCITPTEPCRTLQAAVDKASDRDTIHMAAGVYGSPDESVVNLVEIRKPLTIVGAGRDATFINVRTYYGLLIIGVDGATIRDLTIRNRSTVWASTGIGFDDASGEGTIENVRVVDFPSTGIRHDGTAPLTLINVLIEGSTVDGAKGVQGQNCVIRASEIRDGYHGVLCSRLVMDDSVIENNVWYGLIPFPGVPTSSISIRDSRIENNGHSGIFINGGSTVLNRVTLAGNGPEGVGPEPERGAITISDGASLEVNNSAITGNYQGIYITPGGGSALVRSTQILDNLTAAIDSNGLGETSIVIIDADVSGNNGGDPDSGSRDEAAILSWGPLEIRGSTIDGNSGVALRHGGGYPATIVETSIEGTLNPIGTHAAVNSCFGDMRIERSLIANNAMPGVEFCGNLEMVNTTVSGNEGSGVATYGEGSMALHFVTIVENLGNGVFWYADRGATATVENSLISSCFVHPYGPASWVTMSGVNVSFGIFCGFPETYSAEELLLGPLADNSGPTWTHALLEGSPAIDVITDGCISEDQRNLFRPNNGACDVGAFEYHFAIPGFIGARADTILIAIPTSNTNCRLGNSTAFDIADTLFEGVEYTPIGRGADNLWLLFEGPATQRNCWAFAGGLNFTVDDEPVDPEDIAPELLPVVAYPAPPEEPDGDDGDQGSAPAAPANAYINQTCNDQEYKVQLVWFDASDNEDGFRIYRDGNLIASKGAGSQQHNDFPPIGGPYNYTIEAFNESGSASTNVQDPGCLP